MILANFKLKMLAALRKNDYANWKIVRLDRYTCVVREADNTGELSCWFSYSDTVETAVSKVLTRIAEHYARLAADKSDWREAPAMQNLWYYFRNQQIFHRSGPLFCDVETGQLIPIDGAELGALNTIYQQTTDATPWLVYCDILDDRNLSLPAQYIRHVVSVLALKKPEIPAAGVDAPADGE